MLKAKFNMAKLPNNTIALLNSLRIKARKKIGVFKVADILEDHRYANALFSKAIISGDDELISLVLEINKDLNIEPILIRTLVTYVKNRLSHGSRIGLTDISKGFLEELVNSLYGVRYTGIAYRQAANELLLKVDEKDKALYLKLIRSFYSHWKSAHGKLGIITKELKPDINTHQDDFIRLWGRIDDEEITATEADKLNLYVEAIKDINVSDKEIDLRTKIAKVIIVKQRQSEKTSEGYRRNINEIKKHFLSDELLAYFLSVSREFYKLWLGAEEQ